jgi:hypothetical protein
MLFPSPLFLVYNHFMSRSLLISFFLVTFLSSLSAQYDPHFDWKVINTEQGQIIFPAQWEEEGLHVAFLTEKYHSPLREDLDTDQAYDYPIILTMGDRISNGYVSTFPRHSVWYSFPPESDMGTVGWYETLALHEGRHMAQFDKLNSHTSRLLYYMGGDVWSSLAVGVTPSWLLEGDAVQTETELSLSGRGRLGSFMEGMKAVTLEEDYSYYKMLNRSYKDFIPNQYSFGYAMTEHMNRTYGDSSMKIILDDIAELPLPLLGYSRGIKEATGQSPRKVYEEMNEQMRLETIEEINEKGKLIQGERVSSPSDSYTFYSYLCAEEGGTLFAIKGDLKNPPRLYEWSDGKEKALFSLTAQSNFSASEGVFLWDELKINNRYPTRQESKIMIKRNDSRSESLDISGLYSPVISRDGERFAALGYSLEKDFYVHRGDFSGQWSVDYEFPEEITMVSHLSWSGEDSLLMVVQSSRGEAIWQFNKDLGFTALTPFTSDDLGRPVSGKDGIFFTLDRESSREICFLNLSNPKGKITQVTNTPYGTDYPVVRGDRLYFVNVSGSKGQVISYLELEKDPGLGEITLRSPLPPPGEREFHYEIDDYHPHSLLNPAGWGMTTLFSIDPSDLEIPFTLISYNEMKTVLWEGGLYYNINEDTLNYRFYGQFSPFYPVLTTQLEVNERIRSGVSIHDFLGSAGLLIPMGYSLGRDQFSLNLKSRMIYQYSWTDQLWADQISLLGSIEVSHSRAGGYRSLQPQWEEYLSLTLRHSFESLSQDHLYGEVHFYTPAILPTHGMGWYGFYEKNTALLTSAVPEVRGYIYEPRKEQILLKGEYLLPLLYPDMALGGFLYIPRISAELFYDRQIDLKENSLSHSSAGGELLMEFNIFSLPVQLEGGVRFSWLVELDRPAWAVVIKGFSL